MVNLILLCYVWLITGKDKYYISIGWMIDSYEQHYFN
jgi:hypothetical protein